METIKLMVKVGKKEKEMEFVSPQDVEEVKTLCESNQKVWIRAGMGKAVQAKVNSKVKTWKRDPNRVQVSLKYGLYIHIKLDEKKREMLLIPVGK